MVVNKGKIDRQSVKQQADKFFDIYMLMGADRSITKLHNLLTEGGVSISLTTLKNYSSFYDWQGRLVAADQATEARGDEQRMQKLLDMNEKQAALGDLAQRLSFRSFRGMFDQMLDDPTYRLTAADSARLMAEGSKLERLARGEVTDRTEARRQAYTVVVDQIVEVFATVVREHALPQKVIDDFISGADAVVQHAITGGSDDTV